MYDGGRILHRLKHRLEDKRNAVLLVRFQAEDTRGRLLEDGVETLLIHEHPVRACAEIMVLDGYPPTAIVKT